MFRPCKRAIFRMFTEPSNRLHNTSLGGRDLALHNSQHVIIHNNIDFLRSVKGYTRLDKIRSDVIRKELEISGMQDVKSKYKQNWINNLERTDNTRLPKHALNYKPRGRRDRGRPRKRWQRVDAGRGQATYSMEEGDVDDNLSLHFILKNYNISQNVTNLGFLYRSFA